MAGYWVFRLRDSKGVCLYVGKTVHHWSRITRTYQAQRPWGHLIDPALTETAYRSSKDTADGLIQQWSRRYKPTCQEKPPTPKRPQGRKPAARKDAKAKPVPELSLVERVLAAQARHREMGRP